MTIGILGGGQLGRMLALAAYPLGQMISVYDADTDACAGHVAKLTRAEFSDFDTLTAWAKTCDVVTFESENIAAQVLEVVGRNTRVAPGLPSLTISQDRLLEKQRLQEIGIETVPFAAVEVLDDLIRAIERIGLPGILKTRRGGYDGKGQVVLRTSDQVQAAWQSLGSGNLIFEGFADFSREVSVIGVRGRDGKTVIYPLVENVHAGGILRQSVALLNDPLAAGAGAMVCRLMENLGHIGALALELFDVGGRLVANEFAPRVHNTGHWTIEGAQTSQFENHVRAITGRPLGLPSARGFSAMVNFVGSTPDLDALLGIPGVHAHYYGKAGRVGRKVGHATVVADSPQKRDELVARIDELVAA